MRLPVRPQVVTIKITLKGGIAKVAPTSLTFLFFIIPLGSNSIVLVLSYFSMLDFYAHLERCYILTVIMALASLISLAGFLFKELRLRYAMLGSIRGDTGLRVLRS